MRINVAQLLKQPIGETRLYHITDSNMQGEVQLLRTNSGILASARLNTTAKVACSRCLEEFEYPLTLDFEEEFCSLGGVSSGLPLQMTEEIEGFVIDNGQELHLDEAIRQHMLLMLPIKPICREDCIGLCSLCGNNLNYSRCGCAEE